MIHVVDDFLDHVAPQLELSSKLLGTGNASSRGLVSYILCQTIVFRLYIAVNLRPGSEVRAIVLTFWGE